MKSNSLIVLVVIFTLLFITSSSTLAYNQRSQPRLIAFYENQRLEGKFWTQAVSVADFLEEQQIELQENDLVVPSLDTSLKNIKIINLHRSRPIRVLDGRQLRVHQSIYQNPKTIVLELGYRLNPADEIIYNQDGRYNDSLTLISTIEIIRRKQYSFNINGQLTKRWARAGPVLQLLEELNISQSKIAFSYPLLGDYASAADPIIIYYEKDNHKIVSLIEDKELRFKNISQKPIKVKQKVVFWVELDPKTKKEIKRRQIAARIIQVLDSPTDLEGIDLNLQDSEEIKKPANQSFYISPKHQNWLREADIKESDWYYVNYIINRESRWRYSVWNQEGSSAYGLCQALPPTKMAKFGSDYMTNPATQLRWCDWYAKNRYGGWQAAYSSWLIKKWW